jgi:hypothetical protein
LLGGVGVGIGVEVAYFSIPFRENEGFFGKWIDGGRSCFQRERREGCLFV